MEDQSQLLADVLLEDKITYLWPEYLLPYDVGSPDFKNRDMREMAYLEIIEKLEKSGKIHIANIQDLLKPYLFQNILQYLIVTITFTSDAWGSWV